jgi:Mn-dependent DtxR family transcriptional regulator
MMDINILKSVIPIGKSNAIHQKELANRLFVTPAEAKLMVRKARQQGLQILSGTDGYWFAADEEEKRHFVRTMQKQALSRLKTAKPIKNTISHLHGQISLSDCVTEAGEVDE